MAGANKVGGAGAAAAMLLELAIHIAAVSCKHPVDGGAGQGGTHVLHAASAASVL